MKSSKAECINMSHKPAISLFGIYPKWLLTYASKEICTRKFIAALFAITKTWGKTPKYPKWKIVFSTTEYYSSATMKKAHRYKSHKYNVEARCCRRLDIIFPFIISLKYKNY